MNEAAPKQRVFSPTAATSPEPATSGYATAEPGKQSEQTSVQKQQQMNFQQLRTMTPVSFHQLDGLAGRTVQSSLGLTLGEPGTTLPEERLALAYRSEKGVKRHAAAASEGSTSALAH